MNSVPITQGMVATDNFFPAPAPHQQRVNDPLGVQGDPAQDPLTGLAGRDCFRVKVGLAIACAKQQHKQVGLLLLDMDNLKSVIGHLGPAIGSELWQQVASRVLECLRDSDTASRVSKDELLVLLPEVAGEQGVSELVVHLHRSLVASYSVDGHTIALTASIGAAVYPDQGSIHDDLNRHACMYLSRVHNHDSRYLLQNMALSSGYPLGRLL